jgi:hypothetical protein
MGDKEDQNKSPTDSLFQIFTDSNIVIILWFLAVYFVVYLLLNIFRGRDGARGSLSRWIDIVSLICLLIYLGYTYFGKSESEKKKIVHDSYAGFVSYLNSPLSLISTAFFIFTLYIVIYILALPMDPVGKPITVTIIENVAWIMFILVLLTNALFYLAGISVTKFMDLIGNFLQSKANEVTGNTNASSTTVPSQIANLLSGSVTGLSDQQLANILSSSGVGDNYKVVNGKIVPIGDSQRILGNTNGSATVPVEFDEVFNIGNNMYTYDDAQSVCASFGARLATYDEVESAYNNGGEWCNYGWSDGQAAYFPTQKSTWQRLQKSEKHKNSCGRPGVNGGYIDDPNLRFGVNCFGQKPKPKDTDINAISAGIQIPKSEEDILLEKKIQFWKDNGDKLFKINSYNNNKWSMY